MKFKGTIIITDPCYIIKDDDWSSSNYGENLQKFGFTNYITKPTIYGDWSCTVYKTNKNSEEVITYIQDLFNRIDESTKDSFEVPEELSNEFNEFEKEFETLGEFCADAGLVGVYLLDEVLNYNKDFNKWIKDHPWCVTVIPDFDGEIEYKSGENTSYLVGKGNINFLTLQTGL